MANLPGLPVQLLLHPGMLPDANDDFNTMKMKRLALITLVDDQLIEISRGGQPGHALRTKKSNALQFSYENTQTQVQSTCKLTCTRCTAQTSGGTQCKKMVCIGFPTCWQHTLMYFQVRVGRTKLRNDANGARLPFGALFACVPSLPQDAVIFDKGDIIVPYNGEKISVATENARYGVGNASTGPYTLKMSDNSIIDGACQRSAMAMANTFLVGGASLDARNTGNNCEFVGLVSGNREISCLEATVVIKNGMEILVGSRIVRRSARNPNPPNVNYPLGGPHELHDTRNHKPSVAGCAVRGGRGGGRGVAAAGRGGGGGWGYIVNNGGRGGQGGRGGRGN